MQKKLISTSAYISESKTEKIENTITSSPKKLTILIIDDQNMILNMYKTYIESKMHLPLILTASNSREALELFKMKQDKIGLIILDLNLNGEDGYQLFDEFRKIEPNIRIIINSGYPENPSEVKIDDTNYMYFTKSTSLISLRAMIEKMLDME